MAKIKNKQELISKIKNAEGFSNEEKSQMLALLNENKTYGLVWEKSTEDAWEMMKDYVPVLKEDESKRIDHGSENPNHVLIEGDNLHTLTALSYSHYGDFDVIYIDPPYNTGARDWKYNNDYVDSDDAYRHSKWLSFMERRLKIAKQLLNPGHGILIVAIDDYEMAQLSILMEGLFPAYDICPIVVNHHPQGGASDNISRTHEYALFVIPKGKKLLKGEKSEGIEEEWSLMRSGTDIRNLREGRPKSFYAIYVQQDTLDIVGVGPELKKDSEYSLNEAPEGCFAIYPISGGVERVWRYTRDSMREHISAGDIKCTSTHTLKVVKKRAIKYDPIFSLWSETKYNAGTNGTNLLYSIFGDNRFSYPKSLYTVYDCIKCCLQNKVRSKILDFFAGSGTTLHATMQLNAEDGGHRQCILVTNNENNICEEVTYERNKRVIEGYTTPKGEFVEGLKGNNLRYFKVGFTPREKTDENMFRLAKNSVNLLRIKHDVYKEKQLGVLENPYKRYRYFEEDGKQLLVILDTELIGDIVEQLEEMEVNKPIPTYVFATGAYPFTEDFKSVADKVELYPLPHSIYQACERNMPKMIDKEIENPEGISLSNEELETSMDDLTKEEA